MDSHGTDWVKTPIELENHISPEDLQEFLKIKTPATTTTEAPDADYDSIEFSVRVGVPNEVDCFGFGPTMTQIIEKFFNMKPDSSEIVNTQFYFSSRNQRQRVQVFAGDQFGLEWVDYKPERKTIMIVHGYMSYSNASWVNDMTRAFLEWGDVNVIAVDWSGGGNTWKYWRAVANTRRVGSDITAFLNQLMAATGAKVKDFHFVGHSLGAHISSYVSFHIGRVARITGLDPAQPCYGLANSTERLDATDADFVDIIHTNGRLMTRIGLGLPDPLGDADFYPNGGMKQPGCFNNSDSKWARFLPISPSKLQQAICSHGRAYLLFTESLVNNNCTFRAYPWNLTYQGVNASIRATCDKRGSCSEMGIRAVGLNGLPRAHGTYFTLTTEKEPYCPTESEQRKPWPKLLWDLRNGFTLNKILNVTTVTQAYADPMEYNEVTTTTQKSWWNRILDTFG
ncbi:lipase member I isoform X2 [Manduca sexta]|uniref:lipase member I isoform X2 n=1 Tax=Manduca sexta TaxID=7130 RepID=UPI0011840698|nr:lipase member I isoform X2 [Manduca sexta]